MSVATSEIVVAEPGLDAEGLLDLSPIVGLCMTTRAGRGDEAYWMCQLADHAERPDHHFFIHLTN